MALRQTRKKVLSGKKTVYPSNRGCAVSVSPDAIEKLQKNDGTAPLWHRIIL